MSPLYSLPLLRGYCERERACFDFQRFRPVASFRSRLRKDDDDVNVTRSRSMAVSSSLSSLRRISLFNTVAIPPFFSFYHETNGKNRLYYNYIVLLSVSCYYLNIVLHFSSGQRPGSGLRITGALFVSRVRGLPIFGFSQSGRVHFQPFPSCFLPFGRCFEPLFLSPYRLALCN
ncbi:MAG TPA: hypothetical protein PLD93_02080 [Synergistaceae bacterium]|nr:hypothetical protein [Synergistaceae bacterium]